MSAVWMTEQKDPLKEYRGKRNFRRSPEPSGRRKKNPGKQAIFVIQKHPVARNLHYDFHVLNLTALKQTDSKALREAFSRSGDKLRITVTQAKWLGDILARLNDQQIEDAFRAGNYSPAEIPADGGGPAHVVKVGALALASATRVPLVPLSANCHPAIVERRKWDAARNPVPFAKIAVARGEARTCGPLSRF
jgi:hypothetical protein